MNKRGLNLRESANTALWLTKAPAFSEGFVEKVATWIMCAWMVGALSATLIYHIADINSRFTYDHGFVSADVSVAARTFAERGVLTLGGVPINNNGPIGPVVSAYTHWPPLLPIFLSFLFRLFGSSEGTGHALMLVTMLLTACGLFLVARSFLSVSGAFAVVFSWLTMGAVVKYGHLISQQSFAVLFAVFTIVAFGKTLNNSRRSNAWGVLVQIFTILGVFSSWEAAFIPAGLLISAYWSGNRDAQRLAKRTALSAAVALATVFVVFAVRYPTDVLDSFRTLAFRMGISREYTSAKLYRHSPTITTKATPLHMVFLLIQYYRDMLGPIAVSAVLVLVLRSLDKYLRRRINIKAIPFVTLMAPWFFWYSVMWEHVSRHDFEMLITAPAAAMAMGYCFTRLVGLLAGENNNKPIFQLVGLMIILPLALCRPLATAAMHSIKAMDQQSDGTALEKQGEWLRSVTPVNGIIIQPGESMIPVYYSNRHTIRNVVNDKDLASTLPLAIRNFRGYPIYLALTKDDTADFQEAANRYSVVASNANTVLYCLTHCPSISRLSQ